MHPSHALHGATHWEHKMQQGHGVTLTCALIYPLNSMPVWLHAAPHTYQLVRDHSLEDWHTCTAWGPTSLHNHVQQRVIMPYGLTCTLLCCRGVSLVHSVGVITDIIAYW